MASPYTIENTQLYQQVRSLNINSKEMIRIIKESFEYYLEIATPTYLVVPFAIYNSSPEDRVKLVKELPEKVTRQLVPIDWKDKWAPMQPFLLK